MKKMSVVATKQIRGGIFAPSFTLAPSWSLGLSVGNSAGSSNQS